MSANVDAVLTGETTPEQERRRISRSEVVRRGAWTNFQRDTKDHEAEVFESAGFRRVAMRKPGSGFYAYTVTTWPGYLAVTGDMGAWVFSRLPDMFEFFRASGGRIDPSYWSEKLVAVDAHSSSPVTQFDIDTLRESIRARCETDSALPEAFAGYLAALDNPDEFDERGVLEALIAAGMEEPWECRRTQFTTRFLWICHAIVLAIAKYDQRSTEAT